MARGGSQRPVNRDTSGSNNNPASAAAVRTGNKVACPSASNHTVAPPGNSGPTNSASGNNRGTAKIDSPSASRNTSDVQNATIEPVRLARGSNRANTNCGNTSTN